MNTTKYNDSSFIIYIYFSVYLTCTSLLFFTIWKSGLLEMKLSTHTAGLFLLQSIPTGSFEQINISQENYDYLNIILNS